MRDLTLEDFPIRSYDKLRYRDTDRQGHVNNAVFSTFLETGRTELFYGQGGSIAGEGGSFVLARLLMEYRAEVLWPGEIWIGTGVLSIGRSSVQMRQVLFQNGKRVANADTVMVRVDNATRRSSPLSEDAVARLNAFLLPQD